MTKMWPAMKKFPNSFQLLRVCVSAASRPGQPPNLRLIQPNYTALITAAEGSHPLFSSYNWGPGQKLWDDEACSFKVVCSNFVKKTSNEHLSQFLKARQHNSGKNTFVDVLATGIARSQQVDSNLSKRKFGTVYTAGQIHNHFIWEVCRVTLDDHHE